jgi:hypothetical protein
MSDHEPRLANLCIRHADVAQLVEHLVANEKVAGSSPVVRSTGQIVRPGVPKTTGHTVFLVASIPCAPELVCQQTEVVNLRDLTVP